MCLNQWQHVKPSQRHLFLKPVGDLQGKKGLKFIIVTDVKQVMQKGGWNLTSCK